jgi:hypothetical protein
MIPAIGLMIAAYTFTRMIELLMRPDRGIIVKIFAVLTLITIALASFALMASSISGSSGLGIR